MELPRVDNKRLHLIRMLCEFEDLTEVEKQFFFLIYIFFFVENSFHVDIVVRTFVIRAVVRTKNRAEKSSKFIAIVKIERLKRLAIKFVLVLH